MPQRERIFLVEDLLVEDIAWPPMAVGLRQ
jgi:hypothetical protein